jgi:hypothetical protein
VLSRRTARQGLAGVRILMGTLGLVAPAVLIKRMEPEEPQSPAAVYAFRLFGIRTILLGLDLLVRPDEEVQRELRQGIVIHGSDVVTVVALGLRNEIPRRAAVLTTLISGANLAMAVIGTERRS